MNKSNPEILIVDDIPLNAHMLEEILSGEYTIHVANTGSDALSIAELHRPDLVLLDIVMPEMDGFELFRRLRMIDALADVPVIFVTMLDSVQNESSGLTLGAADYIFKPFHPEIVRLRVRNILELKRQRDLLQEQKDQLVRRNEELSAARAKSVFLTNMSHELRTPLHAVLGFADLLELDESLSIVNRDKVKAIRKSGSHLLSIVENVLEMSRIEAEKSELREQSLDLHTLLDDLAVMFRLRAENKGLSFVMTVDADLPTHIVGDAGKLRQVLINLFSNAVKFTNQGSVVARVRMAGAGRIAVDVKDTGIGIAPENLPEIFLPFEQVNSGLATHTGGIGLGLAISREYARLMGGDITAECQIGNGCCFRLEFRAQVSGEDSREIDAAVPVTAPPDTEDNPVVPTFDKMPHDWHKAFREALSRKSITRLRHLGEEAQSVDPALSAWILERAGRYDLDGLKKLGVADL